MKTEKLSPKKLEASVKRGFKLAIEMFDGKKGFTTRQMDDIDNYLRSDS